MGDRVVFVFHRGDYFAPAVYSHWAGSDAVNLLMQASDAGILRGGDPGYSAARMCGFLHEQEPRSTTGLRLIRPPADIKEATSPAYSHGDAGVIVIDCGDQYACPEGKVSYHAGYLAKQIARSPGYEMPEGAEYPTTIAMNE